MKVAGLGFAGGRGEREGRCWAGPKEEKEREKKNCIQIHLNLNLNLKSNGRQAIKQYNTARNVQDLYFLIFLFKVK
jgi:hypothetical protein